jgi:hypothetical protein
MDGQHNLMDGIDKERRTYGREPRDTRSRCTDNIITRCNTCKYHQSNRPKPISSSDSSFSSSLAASAGASASAAGPPPAKADGAAAGAPPPAPTFERRSLMFLPSSAFARRVAQMGSISTDAADVNVIILSD